MYVCTECGSDSPKWAGKCADCGEWNTMQEIRNVGPAPASRNTGYAAAADATVKILSEVPSMDVVRQKTNIKELDRVLGGGMVSGSVTLIGGDPGIGKSTLLLQSTCTLSQQFPVLYVTGEESLQQVCLRAKRLDLNADKLHALTETNVETIIQAAQINKPKVLVIDSIQTMFTSSVQSAPGSVSQVRESAAQLVRYAKQTHTALFLVGHVTKEGAIAGPRVLEHMVDSVLYFEGQNDSRYRLIRSVKNRFGAVNEIGVFAMTDKGLKEVSNPSAIFLSNDLKECPGSVVMVSWEGSRPLLVEVQALVDSANNPNPRRLCVGLEQNRLAMLLAVLSRHGSLSTYDQDVFVNVVGGVKITETGSDLAMVCAVYSSFRDKIVPRTTVIFGEIGLSGEIRPVQSGQERLKEAAKHGFTHAIVPKQNVPKGGVKGLKIVGVSTLRQALDEI